MSAESGDLVGDPGAAGAPPPAPAGPTPGAPGTGEKTPRFLTPPPPPSLSNSPELRKLLFLGLGLVVLVLVTVLMKARQPAEEESAQKAPPVVESPEERQRRVSTLYDGALMRLTDGADFDQSVAYLDVVRGVAALDSGNVHERSKDHWLDWATAVNSPGSVRGDFVRVRGIVGKITPVKLRQTAGSVEDVYRFFVSEGDGSEATVVDLVKRPTESIEEMRDAVDLEGVFVRTVGFEAEKTGKRHEVPYLVGLNVDVIRSEPSGPTGPTAWILLGGMVVLGVVIAALILKTNPKAAARRHPALLQKPGVGIREMFEMRMREEAARRGGADPKSTERK